MSATSIFKHKYLLMCGGSNQRVVVTNTCVDGATKSELQATVAEYFPDFTKDTAIVQMWNRDYNEFVDIEEGERVLETTKVRVNRMIPVCFSQQVLESGGVASVISSSSSDATMTSLDWTESDDSSIAVDPVFEGDNALDAVAESESESEDGSLGTGAGTSKENDREEVATPRSASACMLHFKLPVQPPSLEMKAKAGIPMNLPERGLFLQNIYDAFVKATGTRLPTKSMYDEIVLQLFSKYPKLAHPQPNLQGASMKTIWKNRVLDKFRNNRKRRDSAVPEVQSRKRSKDGKTLPPSKSKPKAAPVAPQWGIECYLPPRPASEDDTTVAKHQEFLKKEKSKRQPDYGQVKLSMDKTFADRRKWLVTTQPRPKMAEVKEQYPWLFDEDQLFAEMLRLQNTNAPLMTSLKKGLSKYSKALVKLGNGKKKPSLYFTAAVAKISVHRREQERQEAMSTAAFLAIPGLLQEKLDDLFVLPEVEPRNPVHLKLDKEQVLEAELYQLIADGETIATSDNFFSAIAMWMSSFYIFNLAYLACLGKTLIFCQKILLNIQDGETIPRAVVTLTNKLNIENAKDKCTQ